MELWKSVSEYKSTDAVAHNQYVSMPGRWMTGKNKTQKIKEQWI